jgi:hypothetical protein
MRLAARQGMRRNYLDTYSIGGRSWRRDGKDES